MTARSSARSPSTAPRPGVYADKEVALLQTFARQAVVAIENVRLFNETKEALERQTATAEVLQVISGSVADTAPVFDKILECCERLLPAASFQLHLVDDAGRLTARAPALDRAGARRDGRDRLAGYEATLRTVYPMPLADTAAGRWRSARGIWSSSATCSTIPACRARCAWRRSAWAARYSSLTAPLMWEGRGIGTIAVDAGRGRPFAAEERALLKTFADQAVIAIQNARLFNETKEALEQQTATAEVLQRDQQFGRRCRSRCSTRSCESCQPAVRRRARRRLAGRRRRPGAITLRSADRHEARRAPPSRAAIRGR